LTKGLINAVKEFDEHNIGIDEEDSKKYIVIFTADADEQQLFEPEKYFMMNTVNLILISFNPIP